MTSDVDEDIYVVHFALFSENELVTFEEATTKSKWVDAMN